MTVDMDKNGAFVYEKPSLKKYGDMKLITRNSSGSLKQTNSKDSDQLFGEDFPGRENTVDSGSLNNAKDFVYSNNNPLDRP